MEEELLCISILVMCLKKKKRTTHMHLDVCIRGEHSVNSVDCPVFQHPNANVSLEIWEVLMVQEEDEEYMGPLVQLFYKFL